MKYKEHKVTLIEHLCEDCERPLGDCNGWGGWTKVNNGDYYCLECALKNGIIDADTWVKDSCFSQFVNHPHHATYSDGIVTIYQKWGKKFRKFGEVDILKTIEASKSGEGMYYEEPDKE